MMFAALFFIQLTSNWSVSGVQSTGVQGYKVRGYRLHVFEESCLGLDSEQLVGLNTCDPTSHTCTHTMLLLL